MGRGLPRRWAAGAAARAPTGIKAYFTNRNQGWRTIREWNGALMTDPWPWADLGEAVRTDPARLAAAAAAELWRGHGVPRDPAALPAYLDRVVPAGALAIYGAGTGSQAVLDALAHRSEVRVAGFIDRRAGELGTVAGLPVVAPAETARLAADHILLAHPTDEALMAASLAAAGVPEAMVIPLYTNPRLAGIGIDASVQRLLAAIGPTPVDALIIRSSSAVLVEDGDLARLFPPDRTLVLDLGRPETAYRSRLYRTVSGFQSLRVAAALLERLAPRVVYLSTGMDKDAWSLVLRPAAGDAVFIHEIYDWWILYDQDLIGDAFDLTPRQVALARLGSLYSGRTADAVVSNRSGPGWEAVTAPFAAPYFSYFPAVPEAFDDRGEPAAAPPRGPGVNLIYAGHVARPQSRLHGTIDHNFLPLFEELTAIGQATIHLYNASHRDAAGDTLFRALAERCRGPHLHYHRRVPADRLLALLPAFDFGWHLIRPRTRPAPDQRFALTHRFGGYIRSGLPVLIDPGWERMAALVKDFGAGVVDVGTDAGALLRRLVSADQPALRAGVRRLGAHMRGENDATLDRLAALVAARRPTRHHRRPAAARAG